MLHLERRRSLYRENQLHWEYGYVVSLCIIASVPKPFLGSGMAWDQEGPPYEAMCISAALYLKLGGEGGGGKVTQALIVALQVKDTSI